MQKLQERVDSTTDRTVKLILGSEKLEFACIRKGDGKDIICVPSQSSCKMGCTFCFLTGQQKPVKNLSADEIVHGVNAVISELQLPTEATLLISFMGSGEPLLNISAVIEAAKKIQADRLEQWKTVRFALATMLPKASLLKSFAEQVKVHSLPFKVHLSLHSAFDTTRRQMMPNASPVAHSVDALVDYAYTTNNPVEIHYTLIEGQNDWIQDQIELNRLVPANIPIKFLAFKNKPGSNLGASQAVDQFRAGLVHETEFYDPPGSDIGASCGQFCVE